MTKCIQTQNATVILTAACAILAIAALARAAPITHVFVPGTTQVTSGVATSRTDGADMVGMEVTVYFVGGGSETRSWAADGAYSGIAAGTGWSLAAAGDTYSDGAWTLGTATIAIDRLTVDGRPGDVVFDTTFGGSSGTTESGWGESLSGLGAYAATVTYSNEVALTGNPAVGDLWRNLEIDFTDAGGFDDVVTFTQDADNVAISGDIQPASLPAPEPVTAALGMLAVPGLLVLRRR